MIVRLDTVHRKMPDQNGDHYHVDFNDGSSMIIGHDDFNLIEKLCINPLETKQDDSRQQASNK